MKYLYKKEGDARNPLAPWISRPVVRLWLSFGDHKQIVYGLIDSGADETLFHASLARALGITTFERQGLAMGISGKLYL